MGNHKCQQVPSMDHLEPMLVVGLKIPFIEVVDGIPFVLVVFLSSFTLVLDQVYLGIAEMACIEVLVEAMAKKVHRNLVAVT